MVSTTTNTHINTNANDNQNLAVLLGLISVMAFSLTLPFAKVAVQALTGLETGLLRCLIAGMVAIPILWLTKSSLPNRLQVKRLFLGSLGIVYGFPIFSAIGMQTVPVSHGAIVLTLMPLTTAVLGSLLTKKPMSVKFWLWSVLGGVLVLGYVVMTYDLESFGFGDVYLVLAMFLGSFGYVQSSRLASCDINPMKGWQVVCWMVVLNLPVIVLLCLLFVDISHVQSMTALQTFALLFLGLVSNLLAFFSWNKALAMGGIAKISQLQLLQTFMTYGVAIVFMNEMIDLLSVLVCVLVVVTVYMTQQAAKQSSSLDPVINKHKRVFYSRP